MNGPGSGGTGQGLREPSWLAEMFLDPWMALLRPRVPGEHRFPMVLLSATLWLLAIGTAALAWWLAFTLADFAFRPVERLEGVVLSRTWRPASSGMTVAPVISANGQVSTAVVPDHEPERYVVCLRIGDQAPCVRVRPARFEVLRPGTPVAVLARRGRISGSLSVSELLEEDTRPGAGR